MTTETGTFDADHQNEIYLTPIMQTFDYEEPIKHEPVQMFYSENPGKQYLGGILTVVISGSYIIYGDL